MNKWTSRVLVAIILLIAFVALLIRYDYIDTPWGKASSVEYEQARVELAMANGGDEVLERQLDVLRDTYRDELDPEMNEALMVIQDELLDRQRRSQLLQNRLATTKYTDASGTLEEIRAHLNDSSAMTSLLNLTSRMPDRMVEELQAQLAKANENSKRLSEQLDILRKQQRDAARAIRIADSLDRVNKELLALDSLAALRRQTDSLAYDSLMRLKHKAEEEARRRTDLSIVDMDFRPVRASRRRDATYRVNQIEKEGFMVNFRPIVRDADPKAKRDIVVVFHYPDRASSTPKTITMPQLVSSGDPVSLVFPVKWPHQGQYICHIVYKGEMVIKAEFVAN